MIASLNLSSIVGAQTANAWKYLAFLFDRQVASGSKNRRMGP